jgi:dipeptidyl aminopeptidase/acylaminoacyl peptidase
MAADGTGFPANEDLRKIRAMAAPQLSPDGQRALVTVSEPTAEGAAKHLWLIDIKSGTSRQLTWPASGDKKGENAGRWMPDGSAVLFLAKRGEHTQLFRLPMEGGEAQPYDLKITPLVDDSLAPDALPPRESDTKPENTESIAIDVKSFSVSPDSKTIALLAADPETPGEKAQKEKKADASAVGRGTHGTRLYFLDIASSQLRTTGVAADVQSAVWSPAGDRLVVITDAPNNEGDVTPARHAWLLRAADPAHPDAVSAIPPTVENASWSEDGNELYYLAQAKADAPPGVRDLYELDLRDGKSRDLSEGFAGTIVDSAPIAVKSGAVQMTEIGTRQVPVRFVGGKAEPVTVEQPVMVTLATNSRRSGWLWVESGSASPDHLRYAETLGGKAKTIDLPALAPAWQRTQTQLVHWKNDGTDIEGLLSLPPQAQTGKVPLIALIHGGPTGVWQDKFSPLVDFLLGQGWAVLRPNPRGSTGYGAGFAAANHNDLGGADFADIMTGLDKTIADYPIDGSRLALIGYSYGGEMAGFAEGKTDRFKAIVSGAPVTDQMSEYGTEDGSYYDRWFYGYPWDHHEDAWRQSPIAYVAHAHTPFLLLQGEDDTVDPLGQSLELYRALRQVGVPVEMAQYPREDHGPLSAGINGQPSPEPWHGFDARARIVRFIAQAFGKV